MIFFRVRMPPVRVAGKARLAAKPGGLGRKVHGGAQDLRSELWDSSGHSPEECDGAGR